VSLDLPRGEAAGLMDAMYRHQRHIYDASRKFYLLGRDELIAGLAPPAGGSILEVGCGTGRNLIKIAQAYPGRPCYGLDVSSEMLATARQAVMRAGLSEHIHLAQADATAFDAQALFGQAGFERIVISYALSMIPPWQGVVRQALRADAEWRVAHRRFRRSGGPSRGFQGGAQSLARVVPRHTARRSHHGAE
jgi:S-adenosylmethionine-diacylgycerolhomoserine-N-methlytransferase